MYSSTTKRFYTPQFSETRPVMNGKAVWMRKRSTAGCTITVIPDEICARDLSRAAEPSVTVRRLAWAINTPMTKTIDIIINELSLVFSPKDICPKCKDKSKCGSCAFSFPLAAVNPAMGV